MNSIIHIQAKFKVLCAGTIFWRSIKTSHIGFALFNTTDNIPLRLIIDCYNLLDSAKLMEAAV